MGRLGERCPGATGDRKTPQGRLCLTASRPFKQIQSLGEHAPGHGGLWTGEVAPRGNSLKSQTSSRYQMGDKYPIIGSFITSEHICFE